MITWAYGMTTCRERYRTKMMDDSLLGLWRAGFEAPTIFIDGGHGGAYQNEVIRAEPVRVYGNWLLGLIELYIRNPNVDRYAMFQDDIEVYKNLRGYLDVCTMPDNVYWNLNTTYENEDVVRGQKVGWYEASMNNVKHKRQTGRGALALVFSNLGVTTLLSQSSVWLRIRDPQNGWKNLDGAVVRAMNGAGFREYIHNPTLVQHVGQVSSIFVTDPKTGESVRKGRHKTALTWRGANFDAMRLC